MSFNKISRARNLLDEARESIGKIQLNPEVYGSLLILLIGVSDSLEEAVAILAAPPKPRPGRPTLVYSRNAPLERSIPPAPCGPTGGDTMTTKPKTRAPLIREYIRCRNNSHVAMAQAEKKHGKSLEGAALIIAAAEDTTLEYDQFCRAANAERKVAMRMARTTPTTLAGAAALIGHIRHEIKAVYDRENWEDWVPTALKTAASSLTQMGREAA